MPKAMYDRLVGNIKSDRNLSSVPFCWRTPDGTLLCISGHHRVAAAADAGVPLILVLYTDEELSAPDRIAKQLSHNAIVGQDNPTLLRELWGAIPELHLKVYTGLDDAYLKTLQPVPITRLGEGRLLFEEIKILFLPTEIEHIKQLCEQLGTTKRARFAARLEDFDRFFELLLGFKEAKGIMNTATAILAICEIVEEHLAEELRHEPDGPPSPD